MLSLGAAQAAPITISLATSTGLLGTGQVYGFITAPVTAYGFTAPTSGHNIGGSMATTLYGKSSSMSDRAAPGRTLATIRVRPSHISGGSSPIFNFS